MKNKVLYEVKNRNKDKNKQQENTFILFPFSFYSFLIFTIQPIIEYNEEDINIYEIGAKLL